MPSNLRKPLILLVGTSVITALGLSTFTSARAVAPRTSTTQAQGAAAASTTAHVTLLTGDTITLTHLPGAPDHVSVRATPAPRRAGQPVSIAVNASHTPTGDSVFAIPSDAHQLLGSGRLDRGLFDVSFLATRQSAAGGSLALVVRFAHPMSDAAVRAAAAKLTGANVIHTMSAQHAVQLRVQTSRASAFWASVTRRDGSATASLAPGIAQIWLAGHRLGSGKAQPANTSDTFTVTETISAKNHSQQVCGKQVYVCYAEGWQYLLGVTGEAPGSTFLPTAIQCDDPCRNLELTFQVPAGTYSVHNLVTIKLLSRNQFVEADRPEVTVDGDTDLTFDLNDAQRMTITPPQPIDAYNAVLETYRSLGDGTNYTSLIFSAYGYHGYWAIPNDPPTTGGYHLKTTWVLGQPLVDAAVESPQAMQLHPTYPGYRPHEQVRFKGTQTLRVVAAGTGRRSDYQGVDATGKLVLLTPPADGCIVEQYQLKFARQAGAAGVVLDTTNPADVVGHDCGLPILPYWDFFGGFHVPMPFLEIPGYEGKALRSMLDSGDVSVTVTDHASTPYEYDITLLQQDQVPDALHYRFTAGQLAFTNQHNVAATPVRFKHSYTNFTPDESFVGGTEYDFQGPKTHKLYVGPLSPDIVYSRDVVESDLAGNQLESLNRLAVYNARTYPQESWGDSPTVPGFPSPPTDAWQAQPGKWEPFAFCSVCRQDDIFLPWAYLATPGALQQDEATFPGTEPASVHLYSGGAELDQTPNDFGVSEYTLPDAKAHYRLTMSGPGTSSAWRFTSAKPTVDESPRGYVCPGTLYFGLDGPCQAPSVIFLRYNAHADLHNAVTAPGRHTLTVSAYHQADQAPDVTTMKVWTSVDAGVHWVPASVDPRGDGVYNAQYDVPDLGETDGFLSIRVYAKDAEGANVNQTLFDVIGLVAP